VGVARAIDYHRDSSESALAAAATPKMHELLRTLVKVAVASLIVGTILAHFGITAEQLMRDFGLSQERIINLAQQAFSWALPNLLLGSLVIVPVWFVMYLFLPPRSE
jgi:putative exporter of polyketide antibiotics